MSLITENLKSVLEGEVDQLKLSSLQRVDIICAYIKKTGLDELKNFFEALASHNSPIPVRILTTSQLAISQPEAIDQLASLPNAYFKVFKAHSPAFHAKGWLFVHRDETSDVAIVGSSNMTGSAITPGLEWNIATTEKSVIQQFKQVFESYWSGKHPAFQGANLLNYDPGTDWGTLSELFPYEDGPRCPDDIGYTEYQQLNEEIAQCEKRKAEIIAVFKMGRDDRVRKRSQNSRNLENLPQQTQPPGPISSVKYSLLENNIPNTDSMKIDHDSQVSSTSNSHNEIVVADPPLTLDELQIKLYDAILRDNEATVQSTLEEAEANKILMSVFLQSVPQTSLRAAENSERSCLINLLNPECEIDLRNPSLFAIIYSDRPNIVRMLLENGSFGGPFKHLLGSCLTETILHVLARLPPRKACAILKRIQDLPNFRGILLSSYNFPYSAKELARRLAEVCQWNNNSYIEMLDKIGPKEPKPPLKRPAIQPTSPPSKRRRQ